MPGRQSHGKAVVASQPVRQPKQRRRRGQVYNALEIAEQDGGDEVQIPRHRLGDVSDASDVESQDGGNERASKRRRLSSGDAEDAPQGIDRDGSDSEPWHEGIADDDEDSEIDSDDAFGEGDDERFEGFRFGGDTANGGKNRPSKTRNGIGRREDEADVSADSDDFGDEGVDLATAWDMDNHGKQNTGKRKRSKLASLVLSDSLEESADSDINDSTDDNSSEDGIQDDEASELSVSDQEDEGGLTKLQDFVDTLQGGDRVTPPAADAEDDGKRSSTTKLTAADLLKYVSDPKQRQSLKVLINSEKAPPQHYKGGIPGKLEPPLARRQQDRLDRQVAYEKSKDTLNRWIETVKQNRRAEHLSFPLHDPASAGRLNSTQLDPVSQSEPMTELESAIQQIMKDSGLVSQQGKDAEADEQAFEELQQRAMPLEEVIARRAKLRQHRDLMFREEIRARRIKKIKSKAYRRVHRKERDRAAQEERAQQINDGEYNSEDDRERNNRQRAEERMGARHRESKWAKSIKAGRATWDENARQSANELARKGEDLRLRIEGQSARDMDDETSSDDNDDDEDDDFNGFDERLDGLKSVNTPEVTGLEAMAFMQKGEAARRLANDEAIANIRQELGLGAPAEAGDESEDEGRMSFGKDKPTKQPALPRPDRSELEERLSDDDIDRPQAAESEEPQKASSHQARRTAPHIPASNAPQAKPFLKKTQSTTQANPAAHQTLAKGQQPSSHVSFALLDEVSDDEESASRLLPYQDDNHQHAAGLFAGDDSLEVEFEREKQTTIEEEGDQIIDNTLPGWGSWVGAGISAKHSKRHQKRFTTVIKGVSAESRKDAKLDRVIINEKTVKKNGKYLATELPHPFESRQQYERSLRLPVGPEWTTKSTFQEVVKPRVLMKQGVIRAIAKPIT